MLNVEFLVFSLPFLLAFTAGGFISIHLSLKTFFNKQVLGFRWIILVLLVVTIQRAFDSTIGHRFSEYIQFYLEYSYGVYAAVLFGMIMFVIMSFFQKRDC